MHGPRCGTSDRWSSAPGEIGWTPTGQRPEIDRTSCPNHLPVVGGVKYVAYDVAAWADLWFYSNPIYIEVEGSTTVAGASASVK